MKRMIAVAALMAATGMAAAQTGQVRFDSLSPFGGANGGGEFQMSFQSGDLSGSFISFCIELNENLAVGQTYNYNVNTAAINGGVGGGNPDPLDSRTAALYEAFVNGSLADYNYDNDGVGLDRRQTAAALQLAIWFIEEEISDVNAFNNSQAVRDLAADYVTLSDTLALTLGSRVRVLNMFTLNGQAAQDILVLIPLPGATAMAGLGLLAVGARRRRAIG